MFSVGKNVIIEALWSIFDTSRFLYHIATSKLRIPGAENGIASKDGILFEYDYFGTSLCGFDCGAQSSIAAAYDEHIGFFIPRSLWLGLVFFFCRCVRTANES